jgi:hypothetical protein
MIQSLVEKGPYKESRKLPGAHAAETEQRGTYRRRGKYHYRYHQNTRDKYRNQFCQIYGTSFFTKRKGIADSAVLKFRSDKKSHKRGKPNAQKRRCVADSGYRKLPQYGSLFKYHEIPAHVEASARAWFYGKLPLAALCETCVKGMVVMERTTAYAGRSKVHTSRDGLCYESVKKHSSPCGTLRQF